MTLIGLYSFVSYVLGVYGRWARITFRRYGLRGVLDSSYRPRRAGMGRGIRVNPLGRAHDERVGVRVWSIIAYLELERSVAA